MLFIEDLFPSPNNPILTFCIAPSGEYKMLSAYTNITQMGGSFFDVRYHYLHLLILLTLFTIATALRLLRLTRTTH
jgi:hypothetical protein